MTPRSIQTIATILVTVFLAALPLQAKDKGGSVGAGIDAPICGEFPKTTDELICKCQAGFAQGSVWGNGPYTTDSNICTAALHSGAIGTGEGIIQVIRRPGQASYQGSTSNGITTHKWGSYDSSFDVYTVSGTVSGGGSVVSGLPVCTTMPDEAERHACACPANGRAGSVWGSDPYTADSDICTAARHAGILDGAGGGVVILRMQGLDNYSGSLFNGTQSSDWGGYHSSITFDWN